MSAWYEKRIAKLFLFPYTLLLMFSKHFSRLNLSHLLKKAIDAYCKKDMVIISVGSGGEIKDILTKKDVRFKEIDIDKKRKPDIVCSVEDMHMFKTGSVDVFFCMEVLEHVKDPFKAVQEMLRVLRPGGIIVGSTPFLFPLHDEPHDYYRYTRYGLQHLFRECKQITLVERNSYLASVYVVFVRLINTGTILQRLIGVLLFPFYLLFLPFVVLFSSLVTNKQSTTGYFFTFRKKGGRNI